MIHYTIFCTICQYPVLDVRRLKIKGELYIPLEANITFFIEDGYDNFIPIILAQIEKNVTFEAAQRSKRTSAGVPLLDNLTGDEVDGADDISIVIHRDTPFLGTVCPSLDDTIIAHGAGFVKSRFRRRTSKFCQLALSL